MPSPSCRSQISPYFPSLDCTSLARTIRLPKKQDQHAAWLALCARDLDRTNGPYNIKWRELAIEELLTRAGVENAPQAEKIVARVLQRLATTWNAGKLRCPGSKITIGCDFRTCDPPLRKGPTASLEDLPFQGIIRHAIQELTRQLGRAGLKAEVNALFASHNNSYWKVITSIAIRVPYDSTKELKWSNARGLRMQTCSPLHSV